MALDYISTYPKGFLECYCRKLLLSNYDEKFPLANNDMLCTEWALKKSISVLLSFTAAFVIVLINLLIKSIFTGYFFFGNKIYFGLELSKFERHRLKSRETTSRMMKIFFAQFLNTGLLVLVVNFYFNLTMNAINQFPFYILFSGKFKDFTPLWYNNVGTTIVFFFNDN